MFKSTTQPEPFIDKKELARLFRVSVPTVNNWVKDGVVPFYRIGRSVRFRYSELASHFKETSHHTPASPRSELPGRSASSL